MFVKWLLTDMHSPRQRECWRRAGWYCVSDAFTPATEPDVYTYCTSLYTMRACGIVQIWRVSARFPLLSYLRQLWRHGGTLVLTSHC